MIQVSLGETPCIVSLSNIGTSCDIEINLDDSLSTTCWDVRKNLLLVIRCKVKKWY